MIQELGTLPITLFGTDELKQRFLPRCATGEWSPAFALSEPEAGSDPGGHADDRLPRRRRVGHQRHEELDHEPRRRRLLRRLRGHRPRDAPHLGVRRRGRPAGLQRRQARAQARHPAARRPASRSSTTCAIPAENLIGAEGKGLSVALGHARPLAARRRGAGRRHRPGRHRLRRRATRASAGVRPADRRASRASSSSSPTWRRARRPRASCSTRRARRPTAASADLGKYSAMAKLFASDTAMAVTVEAVQVLGGYGYVSEYPVERDDARREDHPDLRGHERDPAARDRPRCDEQLAVERRTACAGDAASMLATGLQRAPRLGAVCLCVAVLGHQRLRRAVDRVLAAGAAGARRGRRRRGR